MVDPLLVSGVVVSLFFIAVFGIFYIIRVRIDKIKEKYEKDIKRQGEDAVLSAKKIEILEQHRLDLRNALDANIKAMDDKKNEVMDMRLKSLDLERNLDEWKKKYTNLLNQKKSSEVRVGLIGEQIAPFLDAWPFETKNFKFMGAPIDGISFEDDGVVFIEIKTGHARLSPKQRQIRKQVRDGKVKFMEFRIEEDGYRVKSD